MPRTTMRRDMQAMLTYTRSPWAGSRGLAIGEVGAQHTQRPRVTEHVHNEFCGDCNAYGEGSGLGLDWGGREGQGEAMISTRRATVGRGAKKQEHEL